jgi:hypothetical protein
MLCKLTEFTFENNPVEKEANILNVLKDKFPYLNNASLSRFVTAANAVAEKKETNQKVSIMKNGADISMKNCNTLAKKKALENTVIKIIQKEWEKEMERLDTKKNGQFAKNPASKAGDKSLVQSGHAEIESNKILYIYGNALEVLQREEFYDVVEEMHLTHVRFDLIVYHLNLEKLRKFTKLKKLVLSHNYLQSFILLSKIECIHSLD